MANKLSPETEDEIVGMYVMAGKSGIEIHRHIGCDLTTVYNVLRRNGIEPRVGANRRGDQPPDEASICDEYELVRAGRIPRKEVLVKYAISDAMLTTILARHGIKTINEDMQDLRTRRKDLIMQAYQQGWPVTKISAAFGVTLPTIYAWLHKEGIQLRRNRTAEAVGQTMDELAGLLEFERNQKIAIVAAEEAKLTGGIKEDDDDGQAAELVPAV